MQDYTAIEAPLNMLADIVAEKKDISFGRPIRITDEVSDISVRPYEIRIHPSMVDGKDLFALLERCYEMIQTLENIPRLRKLAAIEMARDTVLKELSYLWRADPDGTAELLLSAYMERRFGDPSDA